MRGFTWCCQCWRSFLFTPFGHDISSQHNLPPSHPAVQMGRFPLARPQALPQTQQEPSLCVHRGHTGNPQAPVNLSLPSLPLPPSATAAAEGKCPVWVPPGHCSGGLWLRFKADPACYARPTQGLHLLMGSISSCSTKQCLNITKKLISMSKCDVCLVCGCLELAYSNSIAFYLYDADYLEEYKAIQALGTSRV